MFISRTIGFTALLASTFSVVALAQTQHASSAIIHAKTQQSNWFVSAGMGLGYLKATRKNVINNTLPAPWNNDTYTVNSDPMKAGMYAFSFGYQWVLQQRWLNRIALALQYQHLMDADVSGEVLKLSIPAANNYVYRYDLSSQSILFNAKADVVDWQGFMPYVSVGVGVVNNMMSDYADQAQPGIPARVSPGFANHDATQFTYQLGVGLDHIVDQHWLLSLGYAYQDLGDVKTGRGRGATYADQSLMHKVRAQSVLFTISYLFNKD